MGHIEVDEPILANHTTIKKVGRKSSVQIEDPWVERLANVASRDIKYQIMIQQIETGEEFEEAQKMKDCELASMGTYYKRLSVHTLKDGQSIILKDNNEVLIPEKERNEILGLAHAANHKGPEGMLDQLRGKVFWPYMSKQAHKLVAACEPCMRLARSNTQEKVEIKHTTLFNTTLHNISSTHNRTQHHTASQNRTQHHTTSHNITPHHTTSHNITHTHTHTPC